MSQPLVPTINHRFFRGFAAYVHWYLRRHFHAVRLCGEAPTCIDHRGPVVICLNHPSWWDPMVCLLLARQLWPDRSHYAPIDAEMLERYRFFAKLGFFGVEQDSRDGALEFWRRSRAILGKSESVLWITAQGTFADVRRQPLVLRPGVAHLGRRLDAGLILPIALEYVFWDQRLPEALVRIGKPIDIAEHGSASVDDWTALLTDRLAATMADLAVDATSRDAGRFMPVLSGKAGVTLFYDLWQRMRAAWRGERYQAEHGRRDA